LRLIKLPSYRQLFKETIYYAISKAVPGLFGFASIVLFMRIFGASEYGQYSLLISQCNLIVALGFGWLNQAQLRYYLNDRNNNNYQAIQIKALLFCFVFCTVIITGLIFSQSNSIELWQVCIFIILSMGGFNYIKTFYQVKILPRMIIMLTSSQAILALLLPIGLLSFYDKKETTILLGVGLSFFIVIIYMIIKNKNNYSFSFRKNKIMENRKSYIAKWFNYGIPISLWLAAGLALPFLDRVFINQNLPKAELGIYSGIQELLTRFFSLTLFPITLTLHPRIMNSWNQAKSKETLRLIFHSFILMLSLGLIIIFLVWIFNDFIFFGIQKIIPQFKNQYKTLLLPLLCAGFLWQLSFLTHKMLELNEKTYIMFFAILPSLIINLIGNIFFLPKFGGFATAYTAFLSALSYCLITGFYFIFSMKKIKLL